MSNFGYVTYVSEWGEIKEYGIKGKKNASHEWLCCKRYPLNNEPSWGNLIFVKQDSIGKFENTLATYIESLKHSKLSTFCNKIKKIIGK